MKAFPETIERAMAAVDAEFLNGKEELVKRYPLKAERYLARLELLEIESMDRKETLRKLLEVA